uniref:Ovule protein n=1 Tax=Romanomermis culicivorax TaxID=13658 RepID=A0A915L2H5_ROMCU
MMPIVGKLKRMLTIFSINTRSAPEMAIVAQFHIETLATMLSPTSKYCGKSPSLIKCQIWTEIVQPLPSWPKNFKKQC